MSILAQIIVSNFLISLLSLVGLVTIFNKKLLQKNHINLYVSFAAGVMLTAGFLTILPEAVEKIGLTLAFQWVICGVILSFVMERFLLWYHHHHEDTHNIQPSVFIVILGDTIHNFVDGIAIAASFMANPALGIVSAVAIAAHELPQEFADFTVMLHGGFTVKKAAIVNLVTAMAAILGGLVGYFFLQESNLFAYALAMTAGMFIYIACADLIPELHTEVKKRRDIILPTVVFLLAALMMMWISLNISHEDSDIHDEKYEMLDKHID